MSHDHVRALIDEAPEVTGHDAWPEPIPLPDGLAPVDAFSFEFLPASVGAWIDDIAERLQCPPDYVAVTALTALGSIIGRRICVKPQQRTDWTEIANLWGMFIGRPGMLKSPAMGEALKPIHRLEAEPAKDNEIAQQAYAVGIDEHKLRKAVRESVAKQTLKKDPTAKLDLDLDEPQKPTPVRFRTNDTSYESLGELLIDNPAGMLVERDEIVSLLSHLDRNDQAVARGFYLSGWSGTQHLHVRPDCARTPAH
jgi:putative DNA primase/helicase